MNIILQKNLSEKNKITKNVQPILNLSGTLRNDTSIIDPSIIIEGNLDTLKDCNYITIPEFGRSYFVSNITSIRNNLIEITAHVDVLSSFASSILSNTAIIEKQENLWNLYIDDGTFRMYQNPMVLTKEFPSGFGNNEFVLAVAG